MRQPARPTPDQRLTWQGRQAKARRIAQELGLVDAPAARELGEPTTVYLYRGIPIHVYRIALDGGRTGYAASWDTDPCRRWEAHGQVDGAVADAERLIDEQLAG